MKDALSYQVQHLLKEHKIFLDFKELNFQIQSHPTYPSLHAVTGVLDHFNIENLALDIPINAKTLEQLPVTFLAQLEIKSQKQFAVVTKVKNSYKLIFDAKKKQTVSESEFLKQFTGIILAIEKEKSNAKSENANINPNLIKGLGFIAIVAFCCLYLSAGVNFISLSFLTLSLLGLYISTSILKQEQGDNSLLGNAFCSNPTEKKNCNAVLSSKAATIYKDLKLSDLSLMYFLGLGISIVILTLSNHTIFIAKLISIAALPITIYSIYYQSVVIKKWCFLCLGIVALMWCQALISIVSFQPIFNLESVSIVLLSFSFMTAFWLLASKILEDNKRLEMMKLDYFKFKRNFELFSTQLNNSKTINTKVKTTEEIVFGNKNSTLNIDFITNPLCGHCKPAHNLIEQILKSYSESTKLTIRFNINPENPENIAVKIAIRLLEIYDRDGQAICLKAMNAIYGDMSLEAWFKNWEFCSNPKLYLAILQKEYAWCTENSINFTPEILINGKSYPRVYDKGDLIYFIEDLEAQAQISTNNPEFSMVNKS